MVTQGGTHRLGSVTRVWWIRKFYFILLRIIVAPLMVLAGLWWIFMPFAFATMQDPDKPLSRSEYLALVFKGGTECFVIGIAMIAFGVIVAGIPLPGSDVRR
jgi:hypothetical protein